MKWGQWQLKGAITSQNLWCCLYQEKVLLIEERWMYSCCPQRAHHWCSPTGWNLLPFMRRALTTDLSSGLKTSGSQTEKTMYNLSCYNPGSFILAGIPWPGEVSCLDWSLCAIYTWPLWAMAPPPPLLRTASMSPCFSSLCWPPRTSSCLLPRCLNCSVTSGLAPRK